jgi:hypothetical protein
VERVMDVYEELIRQPITRVHRKQRYCTDQLKAFITDIRDA